MQADRSATLPLAVSPGEAARLIGLGRTKIYEAIGSGVLPSFKMGTRRLIRVADLQTWLDAHAAPARAQT